jgi:asparagine synthase (glutamine-hydrolysing)
MCGIAGVFGLHTTLSEEARLSVRRMTARLAHRGPDGDGFFDGPRAVFGHRRLAIIDRAGGHQPMANEDETCWIVFNGEIYNHRALRPLLEAKGHRFRTHSDTEVILHAYEEFGPSCVERLEGMFAFAIYDGRRRELFAARDRVGKKPFFYSITDDIFHFASELPALAQSSSWKGEVDLRGLDAYLSLGYFIAPHTIYRDVFKLPPASWLRVANGRVEVRSYWDVSEFDTDDRPQEELLASIDGTLREAVQARLESEVPLGAFLSGGIDSGLIVSYMAEAIPERLVTTSVGFGHKAHNELPAAALVAAHFGSQHHEELVEPELETTLGPIVEGLGEPLADASAIPTWYVSRAARRHVTVALSGDGGDETFAGYDFRYVTHGLEDGLRRWVPRSMAPAVGWLGRHWPRSPQLPRPLRLGNVVENLSRDPATAYFVDLAFLKPSDTRRLLGLRDASDAFAGDTYDAVTEPYRRCPSPSAVQRAQYADLKVYLPNDPLVKVDRMSMAHSLEVRCPLLDRKMIELAFRIPAHRKQVSGQGKVLLRALARRRLPGALWTLPKRGFTAPVREWLTGPYRGALRDEVFGAQSRISSYVDVAELRRRGERPPGERTASDDYLLWAAWSLERWLRGAGRMPSPSSPALESPLADVTLSGSFSARRVPGGRR